ncbi:hypothetical protein [Paracoccus benzoatiresistens]|uniref:Uncharacterized protein n=1 Tax=Paracoccus benzoatiresistens TaxID=2997341 RepID=A0ABT4J8T8_9RHOB|nr:hypothetical protein [Paracoccus sp. EF6]MCZ0962753.1 hypothetical protein [Paracoccus sp. EF6]
MRYIYVQTGLNHFHSTDLNDMRSALLDEDQDGPDGGSADIVTRPRPHYHPVPARIAQRRTRR